MPRMRPTPGRARLAPAGPSGELEEAARQVRDRPYGATELSIEVAGGGIVGRGLLLNIPRVRRVPWLEPGDHVTADDLITAEAAQEVRIEQGDLLFVRVGHRSRRRALGPWDAANARAGLHPAALELLAERRIAVLGSDGNNDTAPSAPRVSTFPCTCSPSAPWACTSWPGCNSTTSCQCVRS